MMRWIIDSDVLIEGERGHPAFQAWLAREKGEVATADIVRAEFLIGVHIVANAAKRARGETFYRENVQLLASLPSELQDYETAARLAGEARRTGKGNPSLVDGLIAAIALRKGATVATRNTEHFQAMGCPCADPLEHLPVQPGA
jgi:predicted nucleic acid-binding protein